MMIAGKDRLACLIPPPQHLGIIRAKWAALGQPMPIVLALGVEPALPFAGGMPLPEDADESHFLGAQFGEGIEVTMLRLPAPAPRRRLDPARRAHRRGRRVLRVGRPGADGADART
jgi:UbiD family decarboxylase